MGLPAADLASAGGRPDEGGAALGLGNGGGGSFAALMERVGGS